MANGKSTGSSFDQLSERLGKSKLGVETKEIFRLLIHFFNQVMTEKDERVNDLENKVINLEKTVEKLSNQIDETSQYARRDTLIISGNSVPTEIAGENCKNICTALFREHLRLNIDAKDISVAHRIGKKTTGQTEKRNIIFKLCQRDVVPEIYNACKQLKPPFFINDSLTPTRSKISYILRQLKKKYPNVIKGCRSYNGEPKVMIPSRESVSSSTPSGSRPKVAQVSITSRLELENFVREHLDTTLTEASIPW